MGTGPTPSFAALEGVDFSGVRLAEADLTGADLRGASTDGIDWRTLDRTGAIIDMGPAMAVPASHRARFE